MGLSAERKTKHERVRALLEEHDLDGALLTRRCNFSWYTCGAHNHVGTASDVGVTTLLVDRDGASVLANNIEAARLRAEELADSGIEILEHNYADGAGRKTLFAKSFGGRRLAADAPVAGVEAKPLPAGFDRLRWSLTPEEIGRYRSVCTDVVAAVESVARAVERGQTENGLAGMLGEALSRRGCLAWVLLVGADERVERFRHPLPTGKRVEKYFMLATCAERGGLVAACTRLAAFGRLPEELERKHRAVATVDTALLAATQPGVTLGDLFAEAQAAYASVGFPDEWRLHHQGGSIGYLPRDVKAAPGEPTAALENQAFAWNPTITGTKAEDTVLCRPGGAEALARPTDWPTVRAKWKGRAMDRPAILVR